MEYFRLKTIPNLDYEDIRKSSILATKKHVELKNSEIGKQPMDTVIIGVIKQNSKLPKIINFKGSPRNRFFLTEVLRSKEVGLEFQVILTGNYAIKLEAALENIKSDCWLIFSNAAIFQYNGSRSDVAHLSLRLDESDAVEQPQLTMICLSQSPKKCVQNVLIEYVPINSVCIKQKHNIFAVVEEVIKQTVILANGNKHTMVILVDPSSKKTDAVRNALPTHIFFNDPKDNFPEPIIEGDILRIRDAFMEFYPKENKVYGKTFSCNAITKFKSFEQNEEVTPITTYTQYVLTEQDKRKVQEFRKWWSEILNEKNLNNIEIEGSDKQIRDSFLNEKTIGEITEPTTFTLFCQVIAMRQISTYKKFLLLRVKDGTVSKVLVNTVSLPDATQDLLSPNNNAIRGTKEIDVAIFDQIDVAERIKVNDFVKLQNVSAVDLSTDCVSSEINDPIFDFHMAKENCQVIKLPLTHSKVRQIIKRIQSQTEPEPDVDDGDDDDDDDGDPDPIISLARDLRNPENIFASKRKNDEEIVNGSSSSSVRNKRCRLETSPSSNVVDSLVPTRLQSTSENEDNSIESHSILNKSNSNCKRNFQKSVLPSIVDNGRADSLLVNLSNGSPSNIVKCNSSKKSGDVLSNADDLGQKNDTCSESCNRNSTNGRGIQSEELPISSSLILRNGNLHQNGSGDEIVGDAFRVTTFSTGSANLRIPNTPNRIEAIDSPTPFDVTSTPISQVNRTLLYDGLSSNLNLRARESVSRSIEPSSPNEQENLVVESPKDQREITVFRFGQLHSLDKVIEIIESPSNLKSLTQMAQSCKEGNTWQSYVILEEILTAAENPCIECTEIDESLCYHDFVWGLCTKGVHQMQSSELRKRYSREAILKSSILRCTTCPSSTVEATNEIISSPNNSRTEEYPVEPFIKLELKLRDLTNDEVINVHLAGENAERFFGVKPSFSWIVSSCNTRLTYKIFCLENIGQVPLKMGFHCYESNGIKSIQVYGTSVMPS